MTDLVVLNPQWLAKALTCVLCSNSRRSNGMLVYHDVGAVWSGYPSELWPSFLELMFELQIAFPAVKCDGVTGADHCIVPVLLPATTAVAAAVNDKIRGPRVVRRGVV